MRDMLRPLAIQNLKKSAEDCYAVGTLNCFCYMGAVAVLAASRFRFNQRRSQTIRVHGLLLALVQLL